MKLLLLRHAQSQGNDAQRMQGQGDYPLSAAGWQQLERLAHHWRIADGWLPSHVYSSPLQRAVETGRGLLAAFPEAVVEIRAADGLKEIDNGIFCGLTWAEAEQQFPELCQQLQSSPDWIPIPEGESLTAVRDRAAQFIHQLIQQHQDCDLIWVISHGGLLPHLIAALLGCDRVWGIPIPPTALFEFWLDLSRWHAGNDRSANLNSSLWQIRRFNDCQHLNPR